jgi:hypothetical protein
MSTNQPKWNDKQAWKKIANTVIFFTGWICGVIYLANTPVLQPDRNHVAHRTHTVHRVTAAPAKNTIASPSPRFHPSASAATATAAATVVAPPVAPRHLGPFGLWMLHSGLRWIAFVCLIVSVGNFFHWKNQPRPVDYSKYTRPKKEEKPYVKYARGPRDTGPFNPPPWPQLVMAGIGIVVCFTSAAIGVPNDWIGDVYVGGPSAILCISGLMFALGFATAAWDEARARGEDD